MKVTTESGAVYEFKGDDVRRVNPDHPMQHEGEWMTLVRPGAMSIEEAQTMASLPSEFVPVNLGNPVKGKSMALLLKPLCGVPFLRLTTRVVSIDGEESCSHDQ